MNEFVRNTSRPAGRSRRAASGTHSAGSAHSDAPNSENARSKLASGSGTRSAGASTSGKRMPVASIIRRAVSSCAGVGSTPTGLGTPLRQLGGEVRRPAAELNDLERIHLTQRRTDVCLANLEHAPRQLLGSPRAFSVRIGELGVRLRPLGDVGGNRVGQVAIGHRLILTGL